MASQPHDAEALDGEVAQGSDAVHARALQPSRDLAKDPDVRARARMCVLSAIASASEGARTIERSSASASEGASASAEHCQDGICTLGPCQGMRLAPVSVYVEGNWVKLGPL